MPSFARLLPAILLSLLISWPLLAAEVPDQQAVQQQLDSLADRKLPESEEQSVRQQLQDTLSMLASAASFRAELEETRKLLGEAPRKIQIAEQQLKYLNQSPAIDVQARFAGQSVDQLESIRQAGETQLSSWQEKLLSASQMARQAQGRPEHAMTSIAANQARTQIIDATLRSGKEGSRPLSDESRQRLQAERDMLKAQDALTMLQLEGNNLLLGLGNAEVDLLTVQIARKEAEVLAQQVLINDKRLQSTEDAMSKLIGSESEAASALVTAQLRINRRLSDQLLKSTQRLNTLTRENLQARQQLDTLRQLDTDLQAQINALQGSQLLSRVLLKQRSLLPEISPSSSLSDEIADARLLQFELNERRTNMLNPAAQLAQLIEGQPEQDSEALQQLSILLQHRTALIERLDAVLAPLLSQAITLQLQQDKLQKFSTNLSGQIEDQLFWVPSNRAIDLAWLKSLPGNLQRQVASIPWGTAVVDVLQELIKRPLLYLPTFLLVLLLLWQRKAIKGKLERINREIGHYKLDSQLHTPLAILFCVLLGLPVTLLLLMAGYGLAQASLHEVTENMQLALTGESLIRMAWVWLLFYAVIRMLKPGNVGERHFHWDSQIVRQMAVQLRYLGLLLTPLIFMGVMAIQHPEQLRRDYLGVMVVFLNLLLLAWVFVTITLALWRTSLLSNLHKLVAILNILMPLVLAGLLIGGYYYTALMLTSKLLETLYLLLLFVFIDASFVRGLSVAARRLAYARMVDKRKAQSRESADGKEISEEPLLDIASINQQSMRLIRLALVGLLAVALYMIWAELLSAFTYLDNIVLYEYSSGTGANAFMAPLSLGDLIMALILVAVTIMLARNLPGLLEVLVLSRLKLAQGSSYATTTLVSYVIVGGGVIIALGILGLSWDKLQFLVAAFSLGLAFGMQEIFANFISGLIILFERPVRIGDTVTIGNLSGTVSRIQIRATTITDFDRKEIIVPNKTFITDQLVNWSLTDTVTRIVQTIGLSYEADLKLARQLIMQILRDNPMVLRDPEPQIFFVNIGASTFNYEVRFHVKELGDRLPATDEILTTIVQQFRDNHIEMAFNQMDIYVKNLQGQEAKLESKQSNPTVAHAPDLSAEGDAQ
jgi:potassium efflux system protein